MTIDHNSALEQTLPSSWYTDAPAFELEREHIFFREWICVGREEDLNGSGDHKVLDLYGQSILMLRNERNELRAFYNVCRHRGAQLCPSTVAEDSNDRLPLKGGVVNRRSILCPYHAWSYDLNGALQRAPHMNPEMGFDAAKVKLHPVSCETWGGFIFLNLSPESAPSFKQGIAPSAERFQRYPLAELRLGQRIQYEVNANWKVLCENYNECYHCGPVHPELCKIVPAFREAGGSDLEWERGVPHREGAVTFTTSGTTERRMFPGLNQDEQVRHNGDLIYPNLFLSLSSDHVVAFLLHPKGPDKTLIDCQFLFEPFELNKPDFDPTDAIDFWHLVNRQDWSICERVQKGMQSRVHEIGMFSPMEDWNLDIRRYVSDRIGQYMPD
ncbi:MAG: aromatic ring-hydroxylating dioxygenase subunit alpha [Halioglobus sp.]